MIIAYWHKDKVSFLSYMQKRFARIYPVTFLAAFLLLCFKMMEFFLFPEKSDLSITDFFLGISLQQAWIPAKAMSFNTPAWSITVEWFFYLCFPFLFNRFYKRPNLKMLTFMYYLFGFLVNTFYTIFYILIITRAFRRLVIALSITSLCFISTNF